MFQGLEVINNNNKVVIIVSHLLLTKYCILTNPAAALHASPLLYAIVGATVTVHLLFCILHI